ncbi:MAG: DUF4136 domain-containing protein [Acidobacteria bacterium]|nr:DUF4136 domain-containing protein [Acidobacteriota bacterium]
MKYIARVAVAVAFMTCGGVAGADAGVKVKITYDKTHDFGTARTFAWHPDGAGKVLVLEQTGDDPKVLLDRFDPVIKAAIEAQLNARGLKLVTAGTPYLYIQYYFLMGPSSESQFRGQFIGGVPAWGLPDFAMTTSSLKIFEQGTMVLDLVDTKEKQTCWRGIAEAEIQRQRTPEEREKRIQDAVADLLKKFPPKMKK